VEAPDSASSTTRKTGAKEEATMSLVLLFAVGLLAAIHVHNPSDLIVFVIKVATVASLTAATFAAGVSLKRLYSRGPDLRRPILFLLVITVVVFSLHLYVINSPPTTDCTSAQKPGCVMDEVFYVPAAQSLLTGKQCAPYADNCNMEHPFLGKAFIAAGIAIFGMDDVGWRIFNALLGSLSVPLLFALVFRLSGNKRLSYFSTVLFASDTMFFVHSSIALIDVPSVFFSLLAFVVYFWPSRFWLIDNALASGFALGLALLSKETAIFALGVLFTHQLIFAEGSPGYALRQTAKLVGGAALFFFAGLQVYDSLYASAAVPTFAQHLEFIFRYGSSLNCPPLAMAVVSNCGMWTDPVLKAFITPLDWLAYYSPVSYLVTTVTVSFGSGTAETSLNYIGIGFYGVNNVIVLWMVFAWVPLALYQLRKGRRPGEGQTPELKTILFALLWFAWSYLPYIALWAYGRVTYPFYILPAVPAIPIGAAYFISREWFPRKMALIYLIAAAGWFFLYFPVKDFLPVYIRALVGR